MIASDRERSLSEDPHHEQRTKVVVSRLVHNITSADGVTRVFDFVPLSSALNSKCGASERRFDPHPDGAMAINRGVRRPHGRQ